MILYFSATGNGKYIAEQIAAATDEKCISMIDCIREDNCFFRNEKIVGIVTPTYFWRLPGIVARYLEKLRLENCGYIFFSGKLWHYHRAGREYGSGYYGT